MRSLAILCLGAFLVAPVLADWDPGDGHKMHYPQLPDPNGWDVNATFPKVLADDWMCSGTGWVEDIHFWGSWRHEDVGQLTSIHVSIHDNAYNGYSHPGELLWERDFFPGEWAERWYGEGDQGWHDPNTGEFFWGDHFNFFQYNIVEIREPFYQEEGTIYWLDISVTVADEQTQWGWKTSLDHWEDGAVWGDFPNPFWEPLQDPDGRNMDLAFVITPEPASLCLLGLGLVLLRRR